jgi:S1-C subfamily serine protease
MLQRLAIVFLLMLLPFGLARTTEPDSLRRVIIQGEGIVPLPEVGAIIAAEKGALVVKMIAPPERRIEKYRAVDLLEGDVITFVNGTRVKTSPLLEKALDAVHPGEELKLGVQRGAQMMIVSFLRAKPEELPQRQMTFRREVADNDSTAAFPAVGVLLVTRQQGVVVDRLLDIPGAALNAGQITKGDVIKSVNGTQVKTVKEFESTYMHIAVGAEVTFELLKGKERATVKFAKPKPMGQVIIKQGPR